MMMNVSDVWTELGELLQDERHGLEFCTPADDPEIHREMPVYWLKRQLAEYDPFEVAVFPYQGKTYGVESIEGSRIFVRRLHLCL